MTADNFSEATCGNVGHQRQRSIPAGWRGQGVMGLAAVH